jgi:acyl-CoA reductase-like NAD-dependent aldehyde dehydrogenase
LNVGTIRLQCPDGQPGDECGNCRSPGLRRRGHRPYGGVRVPHLRERRLVARQAGRRNEVLLRLAQLIRDNLEELALLDSLDMGKPVRDAASIDVPGSAAIFQWYAEAADKVYDEIAPIGERDWHSCGTTHCLVGLVVPRNFPLDGNLQMRAGACRWQIPWC